MTAKTLALLGLVFALAAQPATAQHPQIRQGFWFNFGLGYGSLGCDDCDERIDAPTGILGLGGTLSQKVVLGGALAAWSKDEGGGKLTVANLVAIIRWYPSATGGFFLTGGLGVGSITIEIDNVGSDTEQGFGALLGLGYDIRVGTSVSITPFLNGFGVRSDDVDANVGQIGVGITVH
jgi:hypothetical protein